MVREVLHTLYAKIFRAYGPSRWRDEICIVKLNWAGCVRRDINYSMWWWRRQPMDDVSFYIFPPVSNLVSSLLRKSIENYRTGHIRFLIFFCQFRTTSSTIECVSSIYVVLPGCATSINTTSSPGLPFFATKSLCLLA